MLKKTGDYISHMQKKINTHQDEIRELKNQNAQLESQIRALEKAKATGNYVNTTAILDADSLVSGEDLGQLAKVRNLSKDDVIDIVKLSSVGNEIIRITFKGILSWSANFLYVRGLILPSSETYFVSKSKVSLPPNQAKTENLGTSSALKSGYLEEYLALNTGYLGTENWLLEEHWH